MELPPLSPSRPPRPLARPSPKKMDFPLKTKNDEHIKNDEMQNEQKLDFIEEDEPFDLDIDDPFMFEEDLRWPSEDRIEPEVRFDPSGFRVYKEAQAKLLEFGFSHARIEVALLEVMGKDAPRNVDEIVMTCINQILAHPEVPATTKRGRALRKPYEDTSKDMPAMMTVVLWTVGSLRARLKRQPNPHIPGFPVHIRHAWTGLQPGRDAFGGWLRSGGVSEDEAAIELFKTCVAATLTFEAEGQVKGTQTTMSTSGQTKLLGLLTHAAEGLESQRIPRNGRATRAWVDVHDDHILLAVWERVSATLNAMYRKDISIIKTTGAASIKKEDEKMVPKVETFASKAGDDLKCAVCWDDLTGESSVRDEENPLESNSDAVKMPQCGHTLCAECTYQWLKSNITSGRLSGDAMRCPLANVSIDSGGHLKTGQSSTAAELEKNEVEGLIRLTAKVGRVVEVAEMKATKKKAKKLALAKKKQEEEDAVKKKKLEEDTEEHDTVNAFVGGAIKSMGGGFCNKPSSFTGLEHPLRPFVVQSAGYRCDGGCLKTITPGTQLYSCRTCNYDLCFDCVVSSVSMKRNLNKLLGEYLVDPSSSKMEMSMTADNQASEMTFEDSMECMIHQGSSLCIEHDHEERPIPPSPLTPRFPPGSPRQTVSSPSVVSPSSRFIPVSRLDNRPVALLFLLKFQSSVEMVKELKELYPFRNTQNGLLDDCEVVLVSAGGHEMHAETPWPAMNFHRHKERSKLASLLGLKRYPVMVLLDKERNVLKRVSLECLTEGRFDPSVATFDEVDVTARHGLEDVMDAGQALNAYHGELPFDSSLLTAGELESLHQSLSEALDSVALKGDSTYSNSRELLQDRLDVARDVMLRQKLKVDDSSVTQSEEVSERDMVVSEVKTEEKEGDVKEEEVEEEEVEGEESPPLLLKFHKFLRNREAERIVGTRWCCKPGCETAISPNHRRRTRNQKTLTALDNGDTNSTSNKQSLGPPALVFKCGEMLLGGTLRCLMRILDWLLRCIGVENVCGGAGAALVCPTCDTDVCAKCGREWHGAWASCDAVTDLTLQEFRKDKFLQPCPSCRREVEKIDACPHMSCPCGHQWCWVCRGNFPCANLHFGKSGYGSSIEIGDVRGIQRLAVIARMVSTCCFFPLFALFLGTASFVWGTILLCTALFMCCFGCWKQIAKIDHPSTACCMDKLRPMMVKMERRAEKVGKVLGYACTGFPIIMGVVCFFLVLFAVMALLHVLGILFIPVSIWIICADVGMWFKIRYQSSKRLWLEHGCIGVLSVFSEENLKLDLYQSALDTNFEVIDIQGSSIVGRVFQGKPSDKFLTRYNPSKGGHLSPKVVVFGRRALACTLFALTFPPTFVLGACLAPLAPFFLLPLAVYPRDPIPRHMAPLVSPIVGALFYALFAFVLPSASHNIASVFSPKNVGYMPAVWPAIAATVIGWILLRKPALSSCSCCAPAWLLAYSIPLSLLVGKNKARAYLAFSPVPDMPLQLPTMFVMLFMEHLIDVTFA